MLQARWVVGASKVGRYGHEDAAMTGGRDAGWVCEVSVGGRLIVIRERKMLFVVGFFHLVRFFLFELSARYIS